MMFDSSLLTLTLDRMMSPMSSRGKRVRLIEGEPTAPQPGIFSATRLGPDLFTFKNTFCCDFAKEARLEACLCFLVIEFI